MSAPVVSTIIPVFNTGKYLSRCIDSILAQSIGDIEIILVDDGSTDDSPAICDEYKSKYDNIKVIHQPNSGVSIARNTGLKLANGKYIHFADSDDFWGGGFYIEAVNQLVANRGEVYCSSSYVQNHDGDFIAKSSDERIELLSTQQAVAGLLNCDKISYSLCDKLFRKSILSGVFFRQNIFHNEDFLFCYEALKEAKNVVVTSRPYYYYCFNQGSAVNSLFNDKKATALTAQKLVNRDMHKHFPSLTKLADTQYYKVVLYLALQMLRARYRNDEILSEVQHLVRSNLVSILKSDLAIGYKLNALALSCGWNILKIVSR